MIYSIYKHTNLINGKSYVGITNRIPKIRWSNGHGYRTQPKFYNAIMKYGWDNFSHEVIATCHDKAVAYEMEKAFIKKYNCIDDGYNVSEGGNGMEYVYDKCAVDKYNPDTGKLICTYNSILDAAEDVGISDSHISECCKGKHKTAAGYGWAYHGEPYEPPKSYFRYVRIEKVDAETGEIIATYDSQTQAARLNDVSVALINMCCKGNQRLGKGYVWRYKSL